MAPDNHPPDLRGLCADVRALRAEFEGQKALMDERDTRYEQAFLSSKEAVSAALQAAKDQTNASFFASEKAISKAEASQLQYNIGHNDLTRKMDAQYKEMLPRPEADSRFKSIEDKLAELREAGSEVRGRGGGAASLGGLILQVLPIIISFFALVVVVMIATLKH
jgi:hypothetical protein